ncbi:aromatic amino acid transaminase [Paraurantiacibacter namhicola]|uniref:Aspartate aminotransferase n=1 Tax=Paraurantiacibacter namhicola TaxID=645517 RepID=A0A1C7D6S6_9SPHN|nr:amino acid aminotransferase [Paraurantiacibacter namhicola]ANU07169.1 Aspartate aminotransferase [Paraurantiacibacter namhicola]
MLERLNQQPPDALLALIKMHAADPRADKIDLGVGVYRTGQGDTPVFGAIKGAERRLVEEQASKSYLGPEGDMGFVHGLAPIVFGADMAASDRIEGMQTPGGTGAVRLALALAKAGGCKRVMMGTPSWPNHAQILDDLGLELVAFDHATSEGDANFAALEQALSGAGEGDAVLLHGCCHNPTGVDYSNAQWDAIAAMLADSPVLPVLDLAYQGLGQGLEEDAYGLRTVLAAVPEALVAYSCDKNFGLYRDRVGALWAMAADTDVLDRVLSNASSLARANWSMPPDHGGAAVRVVLEDADLTAQWLDELEQMRTRINQVRTKLGEAGTAGSVDLTPYARQQGMFAMLPLSKEQIVALREDHGIYMAGSGRINVAGLTTANIGTFVAALAKVTG